MRFFNAQTLAREIAGDRVGSEEKFKYLLFSFIVPLLIGYAGLIYTNFLWSIGSCIEGAGLLMIIVTGIRYSYKRNGIRYAKSAVSWRISPVFMFRYSLRRRFPSGRYSGFWSRFSGETSGMHRTAICRSRTAFPASMPTFPVC